MHPAKQGGKTECALGSFRPNGGWHRSQADGFHAFKLRGLNRGMGEMRGLTRVTGSLCYGRRSRGEIRPLRVGPGLLAVAGEQDTSNDLEGSTEPMLWGKWKQELHPSCKAGALLGFQNRYWTGE